VLDPDGMVKARKFAPEADIERPTGRPKHGLMPQILGNQIRAGATDWHSFNQ